MFSDLRTDICFAKWKKELGELNPYENIPFNIKSYSFYRELDVLLCSYILFKYIIVFGHNK